MRCSQGPYYGIFKFSCTIAEYHPCNEGGYRLLSLGLPPALPAQSPWPSSQVAGTRRRTEMFWMGGWVGPTVGNRRGYTSSKVLRNFWPEVCERCPISTKHTQWLNCISDPLSQLPLFLSLTLVTVSVPVSLPLNPPALPPLPPRCL